MRALSDDVRDTLPTAIGWARYEILPAPIPALMEKIGMFVAVVGQDWTASGRAEYIAVTANDLSKWPGVLVLDSVERARMRIFEGRRLVAWVVEDIELRAARLRAECEQLEKLGEIVGQG